MNRGIVFLANNKSLISFAIMSVEYAQSGKDYFDMLVPFVLVILKDNKDSIGKDTISIKKINNALEERNGFRLQHNVLEGLFRRITNEKYGYLYIKNRNFYYTEKEIDTKDFQIKNLEVQSHQRMVFERFIEYLSQIENLEFVKSEAEQKLILYLNKYGLNVLTDQVFEMVLEEKEDIITHYIGKFITTTREVAPEIFEYIKEIVKGAMLVSALHLQSKTTTIKADKKFEKLNVFFDTPLLVYALGYSGPELKDATMELINTLNELGVRIYYFQHNLDELEDILEAYIRHNKNNTLDSSYNFEYLISNKFLISEVLAEKVLLEKTLKKIGITLHDYCDDETMEADINLLDQYLRPIKYKRDSGRKNDAASVINTYRLRSRHDFKRIENCEYIFATSNRSLCYWSNKFVKENLNAAGYQTIIDDTSLSSIAWLKIAKYSDDIPTLKLISDAIASQALPKSFWEEFIKRVNKIKDEEEISELDVFILKYDAFAKNHIYEITQGEVDKICYENLQQTLELTKYEEHKELIDSNAEKDKLISKQNEIIIYEKVQKYIKNPFSKWKLYYYLSRCGLIIVCILIALGTTCLDSVFESLTSMIVKYASWVTVIGAVVIKFYDKTLSKFVSKIDLYFLKKSYCCLEQLIEQTDNEYKKEIISKIRETKYFKFYV